MPARMMVGPRTPGPAYANLPGRKPREGDVGGAAFDYGDLNAADAVCDWN